MKIGPSASKKVGWSGRIIHDMLRPYRLGMMIPHEHQPSFFDEIAVPVGARKLTLEIKGMHINWKFE